MMALHYSFSEAFSYKKINCYVFSICKIFTKMQSKDLPFYFCMVIIDKTTVKTYAIVKLRHEDL